MEDPNSNVLDYAGLTYYHGKIQAEIDEQSSRIATRAAQTALDSTNREVALIRRAMDGQLMEIETDTTEAYSKTLPSGTIGVGTNLIGGKSLVMNQRVSNTQSDSGGGITFTYIGTDDDPYKWHVAGTSTSTVNARKLLGVAGISGNKYYVKIKKTGTDTEKVQFVFRSSTGNVSGTIYDTGISSCSYISMYGNIRVTEGNTADCDISIRVVDLTKVFGAGNEPTELTDERIKYIDAFINKHPEFTGYQIFSADCDEVQSWSKNLLKGIDFANAFNDASSSSTIDTTNKTVTFSRRKGTSGTKKLELPINNHFKENTRYTFIFTYSSTSNNDSLYYRYTLNGVADSTQIIFPSTNGEKTVRTYVISEGRIPQYFYLGYKQPGNVNIYYDESGIFEGVLTEEDFSPYGTLDTLSIPAGLREAKPLLSAPNVYDDYNLEDMKGHQRVGTRAHQEGDEDDATVITDGTTTQYPLATPVEYDLAPYFPEGFDPLMNAEAGGSLTFHQTETEFPIPNSTDFFVKTTPTTT